MINRSGLCLIADIMGYSNIIKNLNDTELDSRISAWVDLIRALTKECGIKNYQLLSDTLFVYFPQPIDLNNAIRFSRNLIEQCTKKQIPLRGAVTYGEIVWGEFIYGKAVIAAHHLETSQNWLGVVFDKNIPNISDHYGANKLIQYIPPLKGGNAEFYPVISWEVPEVKELAKCLHGPGLGDAEGRVSQRELEILTNVSLFKTYRNIAIFNKVDFKEWCGYPPSHLVEQLENLILNKP
ncbi:MAG: hypothetical protein Q7J38_13170 [Gallionella sp.]|nr:hypothetical protein [Gallionella sp.]